MFKPSHDPLLVTLDKMLGGRAQTQELLAMASAAVLTACPHGSDEHWLRDLRKRIPTELPPERIVLNNRRGPAFPRAQSPEATRTDALEVLLQTLHREHDGDAESILARLATLSASSLAAAQPRLVTQWSDLVQKTHRAVQQGYLSNHPDLN